MACFDVFYDVVFIWWATYSLNLVYYVDFMCTVCSFSVQAFCFVYNNVYIAQCIKYKEQQQKYSHIAATTTANSVGTHTLGCLFYIQLFSLNSYLWFDNHFTNCLFAVLHLLIFETLFWIFVNDERDKLKVIINSVNAVFLNDIVQWITN